MKKIPLLFWLVAMQAEASQPGNGSVQPQSQHRQSRENPQELAPGNTAPLSVGFLFYPGDENPRFAQYTHMLEQRLVCAEAELVRLQNVCGHFAGDCRYLQGHIRKLISNNDLLNGEVVRLTEENQTLRALLPLKGIWEDPKEASKEAVLALQVGPNTLGLDSVKSDSDDDSLALLKEGGMPDDQLRS